MRLVTWNCRIGGYRKKAKHMAALSPDILAVQEVESLEKLVGDLGFTSAYHRFHGEQFGQEKRSTYWHRGKGISGFHLDYWFVPEAWAQKIRTVTVGTHADWHAVSDHAPLIVDLDI